MEWVWGIVVWGMAAGAWWNIIAGLLRKKGTRK